MPLSFEKPQEYILVWSGDAPETITAEGAPITLPPVGVVAVPGKGSIYRYPSAKDRAGKPIPGTVAIHDEFVSLGGANQRVFNAYDWCKMVETNQKGRFQTGFDITTDPDEVAAIQAKGRAQYDTALLKRDEQIIQHALSQASYWKSIGKPQPPSSQDEAVAAAVARMKKRKAEGRHTAPATSIEEMQEALGLAPKAAAVATGAVPAPAVPVGPNDQDLAAISLMEAVREHKLRLTNDQIQGLVERNPAVMAQVLAKVEEAESTPA